MKESMAKSLINGTFVRSCFSSNSQKLEEKEKNGSRKGACFTSLTERNTINWGGESISVYRDRTPYAFVLSHAQG
jgi:hypothetical protein